jgi:protoporphyrinogen oxidase
MKIAILGGGLAGISLAYFLQSDPKITQIDIYEKENELGGLCRSFEHNGIQVDIGPHIFFSKDKETLNFMLDILGENKHELRRSNRIIHKGKFVQYPFENDLSKLPEEDCEQCVEKFLNNPYRQYDANNMLQVFLKIFGEGITNLYLRPYNEKIWKFDPSFMNTQMVDRIPIPPDEDILKSAKGETVEGYTHQLYFSFPKQGATGAFINAFAAKLNSKVKIHLNYEITSVEQIKADKIISCIPPQCIADKNIKPVVDRLRFNNIMLAIVTVKVDRAGDNYAFMIADKDVVFHRLSKVDFLGENYHKENTATYMLEYTYRDGDKFAELPEEQQQAKFTEGLQKIGFIENSEEIETVTIKKFPYAYVIYDIEHAENMRKIREYFADKNILLNGRFGNFEYWNMDRVISESKKTKERVLNG